MEEQTTQKEKIHWTERYPWLKYLLFSIMSGDLFYHRLKNVVRDTTFGNGLMGAIRGIRFNFNWVSMNVMGLICIDYFAQFLLYHIFRHQREQFIKSTRITTIVLLIIFVIFLLFPLITGLFQNH